MSNESSSPPLSPLVEATMPAQVAVALDAIRSILTGLHTRVDVLQAAADTARSDKHRDRNEMNKLSLQITLVEKDVQRLAQSLNELDDMVVRGESPLRERVSVVEREQKDLTEDYEKLQAEREREAVVREQQHLVDSTKRGDRYVQIALAASGWIIAVISIVASIILHLSGK